MKSLVKKVFLTLTDTVVRTTCRGIWAVEMAASVKRTNKPTEQASLLGSCPTNPATSDGHGRTVVKYEQKIIFLLYSNDE